MYIYVYRYVAYKYIMHEYLLISSIGIPIT